ncbi:MAG: L,D-transpeptidase family protein [Gammaproteobacteria bacterium]|nr:L,D-transpeptidase family protein [Gammaproteobacteria bacterium]
MSAPLRLPGLVLLAVIGAAPSTAPASAIEMADRVVVRKSERRLLLMRGDRILRSFDVALGLSPTGHKQREGDFRTPEGNYRLAGRNPNSDFFLAIQVNYPGPDDVRRAAEEGANPGGQIMIHGQPNRPSRPLEYYQKRDWTNGCIAVSNADMVDIWLMTPDNTPIQILP